MAILETIGTTLVAEAATAAGKKAIAQMRPTKRPRITDVKFLNVLPRRIGLPISLNQEEVAQATFGALKNIALGSSIWKCQWIDCAELFFRVENVDKHDSIIIKSIHIETDPATDHPQASLLEETQGVVLSGDCHRFLTALDTHMPTMQKYAIVDHTVEFIDDQDYFDCSSIEIPPGIGANIALTLVVEKTSLSVSEVSILYRTVGNDTIEQQFVEMESNIRIYPLSIVPENQRFRTTWSNLNRRLSSVTTEEDESIIPKSAQSYRWSGYRAHRNKG